MAQVILIEPNKAMNDLISLNVKTYLGVDVIMRKSASDTVSLLNILPNVDIIITPYSIGDENTYFELSEFIKEGSLTINLIVLGGESVNENEQTIHIKNEKDWESVINYSAKLLSINEDVFTKKSTPDYIAVPVSYFLNLDSINCDVFIRIKKSPTEYQYIKRIHDGDTFSKDVIRRYLDQGLENFHIPKDFYKNFATYLSNKLVEKLESDQIDLSDKIQIMGESYDLAMREILKLGFTSETIQLTDTIIQNMVKISEKSPEMSGLLHKVINSKTGMLYQRCHMTSVVALEICKNLNIKDKTAYDKIAFAAFFHDIVLSENEELSLINTFEELENSNISEQLWDLVFGHALEASHLIRKYPEAPAGADEIIKHHHGATNGKGFTTAINNLPPLSKIFIIAHHFVLELVKYKEKGGEPKPITEELTRLYEESEDLLVIIKALEKTLKKKKI